MVEQKQSIIDLEELIKYYLKNLERQVSDNLQFIHADEYWKKRCKWYLFGYYHTGFTAMVIMLEHLAHKTFRKKHGGH